YRLINVSDRDKRYNRTEYFLLCYPHFDGAIREQSRFEEETLHLRDSSTYEKFCSFVFSNLCVLSAFFLSSSVYERPNIRFGLKSIAQLEFSYSVDQHPFESALDFIVHYDTRSSGASLPSRSIS